SVPWMFDLLLAYHPDRLSSDEKAALKEWFRLTASQCHADHFVDEDGAVKTREGMTVGEFANWWSRYLGNGAASALGSGDQASVDYWFDSGWPHDRFTYDGTNDPGSYANRFDLVMNLLAVFPSGANTDSYGREGYSPPTSDWYTVDYTWGGYHWAQMDAI